MICEQCKAPQWCNDPEKQTIKWDENDKEWKVRSKYNCWFSIGEHWITCPCGCGGTRPPEKERTQ
jgi:hypothetical protein